MFKNKAGQFRSGWMILIAFIFMIIGQTIFALPGSIIVAIQLLESLNLNDTVTFSFDLSFINDDPWLLFLTLGAGGIGSLVATFIAWKVLNKEKLLDIGFRGRFMDLIFGLFLGAISITLIFFFLLATGGVTMLNHFSNPEFSIFTLVFLIVFIIVAIYEELFFRGYVMRTMQSRNNKKWVIYVVSAIFFSLMHIINPEADFMGLINIFIVGLLFAYMFYVTGSLLMPIGFHFTWNFFQGAVFGFPVSGISSHGIYKMDTGAISGFGLEGDFASIFMLGVCFLMTHYFVKLLKDNDNKT